MTTYSFPDVEPSASEFAIVSNTKVFISPFTGSVQTASRSGTRWRIVLTFNNLKDSDRRLMQAFIAKLDGQTHRFTVKDHSHTFSGAINGTPLVAGASQTGNSIDIDGLSGGDNIKEGDLFSIGGELKMCTADASASGGAMTISFVPEIHNSPSDNSAVIYENPTGTFMLTGNENGWSNAPGVFSNFSIEAIEDINA